MGEMGDAVRNMRQYEAPPHVGEIYIPTRNGQKSHRDMTTTKGV